MELFGGEVLTARSDFSRVILSDKGLGNILCDKNGLVDFFLYPHYYLTMSLVIIFFI